MTVIDYAQFAGAPAMVVVVTTRATVTVVAVGSAMRADRCRRRRLARLDAGPVEHWRGVE